MLINVDNKERETKRRIKELKNSNKLLNKDVKALIVEVQNLRSLREAKELQERAVTELSAVNSDLNKTINELTGELKQLASELV